MPWLTIRLIRQVQSLEEALALLDGLPTDIALVGTSGGVAFTLTTGGYEDYETQTDATIVRLGGKWVPQHAYSMGRKDRV